MASPDPADTKIQFNGTVKPRRFIQRSCFRFVRKGFARSGMCCGIPVTRRTVSMIPVLQGSALWRVLIQPIQRFDSTGARSTRRFIQRSRSRIVRKGFARSGTLGVLLDFGSAANRLDDPCFAGVCPTANP
jgi:hypothetical protein